LHGLGFGSEETDHVLPRNRKRKKFSTNLSFCVSLFNQEIALVSDE